METIVDDVQPLSAKLREGLQLKEGERAVFKLLSVGKREPGREEPTAPEVYKMAAKESILDPFDDNKRKTFAGPLKEHKLVGTRMVAIYHSPEFIRGYFTVTEDTEMYIRMMRSKHNVSNKFAKKMGKGGRPLFMLVSEAKELNDQLQIDDLKYYAETIVRNATYEELKTICVALKKSPDARLHVKAYTPGERENHPAIKIELTYIAKLYPKQVISASDDGKSKLQVQIFDAMNLQILVFEQGAYSMFDPKGKFVEVHRPEVGADKMASLIEYLMSDAGRDHYGMIAVELQKTLKAA